MLPNRSALCNALPVHWALLSLPFLILLTTLDARPASASSAASAAETAALCDRAAATAAHRWDVPIDVLRAISLTETGRRSAGAFRPWPWTVNMEGEGAWFDTPDDARSHVDRHMARGARSFDVGCFQINFRWHGHEFASIDAMFDPTENADYAARFLSKLYAEMGDWGRAAGAYHSRTPSLSRKYRKRFEAHLASMADSPLPDASSAPPPVERGAGSHALRDQAPRAPAITPRANRFPLLRASGPPLGLGSLVPLGRGTVDDAQPLVPSG